MTKLFLVPNLSQIPLFRMIHVENIAHVLEHGITKITSPNANKNYVPVGDGSIINVRNRRLLDNGRVLGDYIPFYFWYRMPMLYVIQNGYNGVPVCEAKNIVYLVTSIQEIIVHNLDYLFSDGHAVMRISTIYDSNQIANLTSLLDFNAIRDPKWNDSNDLDKKRRKEAEFLIGKDIPLSAITHFVVVNNTVKKTLEELGVPSNLILVRGDCFF